MDVRRYFVARKGDVQAAFQMVQATVQWRQQEAVDRILDQPDVNEAVFQKHVRHHLIGTPSCGVVHA